MLMRIGAVKGSSNEILGASSHSSDVRALVCAVKGSAYEMFTLEQNPSFGKGSESVEINI